MEVASCGWEERTKAPQWPWRTADHYMVGEGKECATFMLYICGIHRIMCQQEAEEERSVAGAVEELKPHPNLEEFQRADYKGCKFRSWLSHPR
ncbi:hypothetical protein ACLOJK_000368 [Asimina triloba]